MPDLLANTAGGDYQILIRKGALAKTGEIASGVCTGRRACVVSDENVWPLYGNTVQTSLEVAGFTVSNALVPAGEASKSMDKLMYLYECFNQAGINRADLIVALGGGVIGDLAGFAAATWLRGVPLVQIPTTLLAQVDSSIGGKTAIDLPFGKNLAGAFYQPQAVIMDPSVLLSLSRGQMADGMAEVIKYGLIRDDNLFEQIESKAYDLEWVLERCVRTKITVVSRDERDTGERMLLNFGHTIGHAIEKVTAFSRYTHGEAVAIGMVAAARVGEFLGETAPGTSKRIIKVLESYQLPVATDLSLDDILPAIASDKKNVGSRLYFVLIKETGQAYLKPMKKSELTDVLREVWQNA
ncbi:MAG: 3-dehydroquinate synthase [Eubacteriales bacterium]|nr:3-dehydroquinate synthase [Eubacteriales bacterium]